MRSDQNDLAPPAFLQLAGHPLRWELLRELGRSDRTVRELTQLVGEPQNLVSYHLGKLRAVDLVRSRRSSADRRDAYYSVDLDRFAALLSATGVAVHPGLRLAPSPLPAAPARRSRVLFLCTGNSARSQMAEALTQAHSDGVVLAHSAGSHPKPLHPLAVQVMRDEHGIDVSDRHSKHLRVFARRRFDRVVSLCDRVRQVCPTFPGDPETIHWSVADPAAEHDADDAVAYQSFQRTAAELERRVGFLLATLSEQRPQHPKTAEARR